LLAIKDDAPKQKTTNWNERYLYDASSKTNLLFRLNSGYIHHMRKRSPIRADKAQLQFEGILGPGEILTMTAVQPERSTVIVEHKAQVNYQSDLNLRQLKLLAYILGMSAHLQNGEKFPSAYRINVHHYQQFLGLKASNVFSELKEVARSLQKTLVYYFDEFDPINGQPTKQLSGTWIRWVAEPEGDGYLTIVLDDKIRERLERLRANILSGNPSIYELYNLLRRSSVYTIHLYRWAKLQQADAEIVVNLAELRFVLHAYRETRGGMVPTLETWDHLKTRALDPAVKEINENLDLTVSYKTINKAGSKAIESVAFRILTKQDAKIAHIPLPFARLGEALKREDPAKEDDFRETVAGHVREFELKDSQATMIETKVREHGIAYVHAQAEVARHKPPDKRPGAFHKACEQDWAKFLKATIAGAPSSPCEKLSANQKRLVKLDKAGFDWRQAALEFDPRATLPQRILSLRPDLADYVLEAYEREPSSRRAKSA
jgi:plasmid replication initiation protein